MSPVKTRFSPSPTGNLHFGGLRTALYNYLYARQHGGGFFLRFDDTDTARVVPHAAEDILGNLAWAGLRFDGEPVVQSQRLDRYQHYAERLLEPGHAYRCFCPPERLEILRRDQALQKLPIRYDGRCRSLTRDEVKARLQANQPAVLRFAIPPQGNMACQDLIHGTILFNFAALDDQILIKSNHHPTYHLASVVDDHEMGITHVIRGEEWLPSLPKHLLLYRALGWEPPRFAHLPLLLNQDRSKLSKRTGDVAVAEYRAAGYLPEAVLNFVLLLGWNGGTNQEIFSLPEMVAQFSLPRVSKSGAVFNRDKLNWLNGWYLRQLSPDRLMDHALPFLSAAPWGERAAADRARLRSILATEQRRLKRLNELPQLIEYFYQRPAVDPKLLAWTGQTPTAAAGCLEQLIDFLTRLPPSDFTAPALERTVKAFIAQRRQANGEFLWPMRVALSGRAASAGPFEIAAALGREETLERLQAAGRTVRAVAPPTA